MNQNRGLPESESRRTGRSRTSASLLWLPVFLTATGFVAFAFARQSPRILWGFNMWNYLYPPIPHLCMALTALISLPPILRRAAALLEKIGERRASRGARRFGRAQAWAIAISCIFIVLWALSERRTSGGATYNFSGPQGVGVEQSPAAVRGLNPA